MLIFSCSTDTQDTNQDSGKLFGYTKEDERLLEFENKIIYSDTRETFSDSLWYDGFFDVTKTKRCEGKIVDGIRMGEINCFRGHDLISKEIWFEGREEPDSYFYFSGDGLLTYSSVYTKELDVVRTDYHSNGELKEISRFNKDYQKNGLQLEYYESGIKKTEYSYINGLLKYSKSFSQNGNLDSYQPYAVFDFMFENEYLTNFSNQNYPAGQHGISIYYRNGIIEEKSFRLLGNLHLYIRYHNGRLVDIKGYSDFGKELMELMIKDLTINWINNEGKIISKNLKDYEGEFDSKLINVNRVKNNFSDTFYFSGDSLEVRVKDVENYFNKVVNNELVVKARLLEEISELYPVSE